MCIGKPKIENFLPIMQKIERSLFGCSTMISADGRLILIKAIFSALPTFYMCSLMLPVGIIQQINKYLRMFFGRKYGADNGGAPLVAWDKVCRPKDRGGLGIVDIATHNKAMLIKN